MTASKSARVLVVDDDPTILMFVGSNLRASGYRVVTVSDGPEALAAADEQTPDLVILDLGLPSLDGLEVVRQLRRSFSGPIIVLTARGAEPDKVKALDLGADDYLTKPFGMNELLARVRAALRRATPTSAHTSTSALRIGELEIDLAARRVVRSGREVKLTRTEHSLLAELVRNADKALSHADLLRRVWGPEYGAEHEYLHTFIAQLRRKLEDDPTRPRYIITEPRFGYRFRTAVDSL
ncbi:MAG: response regulator transcription factor [Chloroflexi bacterium]|nr:response regulator transcription factor [Chloroflexota bacterium]